MEISLLTAFFETNLYLFLFIIAILSQIWIPVWAMFFILIAWSITMDLNNLLILFIIILVGVVVWDLLSYLFWKKLFNTYLFQLLINNKKINKLYIKTENFLNHKGNISIFISRFLITWVWPMLNYIAWIQWFNIKNFALYIFLGEILYVFEFLLLWFIFKDMIDDIMNIISNFWLILILVFILYIIWVNLFKRKKSIVK